MTKRIQAYILLSAAVGFMAACEALDEPDSSLQSVNVFGKVVILVIDNSAGPEECDPQGYIREGSKFLLSTLNREDNIGVVTCRFPAAVMSRTQSIRGEDNRREIFKMIDDMPVGGESRYSDALGLAEDLLRTFNDTGDSYVVFITGGMEKPVGGEGEIAEAMRKYAQNGWRVFPVVLAPTGHMAMLEKMAVTTRGAVFKVEKPENLLTCLSAVSAEINQRMICRNLRKANTALPGSGALVLSVTSRGSKTSISGLQSAGKALPLPAGESAPAYQSEGYFHVVHLDKAPAGLFDAKVEGEPVDEIAFLDAPIVTRLSTSSLQGAVREGEPFRIALSVEADNKANIKLVMDKAKVSASVLSEATGRTVAEIPLSDLSLSGNRVEYEGGLRILTSVPEKEETFTVKVTVLVEDKDLSWSMERYESFIVNPAKPPLFQVSPPEIDFGMLWADDQQPTAKLSVTSRAAQSMGVEAAGAPAGLDVAPSKASSMPDKPMLFTVSIGGALRSGEPGPGRAEVKVVAQSAAQGELRFEKTVPVSYNIVVYRGIGDTDLGSLKEGEQIRKELEFGTEPALDLDVTAEPLVGPGAVPMSVELVEGQPGRRVLVVSTPMNCIPGSYAGTVRISVRGAALAPREVRVQARFEAPGAGPAEQPEEKRPLICATPMELSLQAGADGWVEGHVTLDLNPGSSPAAILAVNRSPLQGQKEFDSISGEFDFITKPGPGWDGKEIVLGQSARLEYRIFVSPDLPDGIYKGKVEIKYRGSLEKEYSLEVPVEIKVERPVK